MNNLSFNNLRLDKSSIKFLFLSFTLIQLPMCFFNPSESDSFKFTQNTLVIREFMREGINLKVPLPVFGTKSFVPFEFPIYQIFASIIGNLFGASPIFAARFSALLFFLLSAFFLYQISKALLNQLVASTSLVLFLFLPFGMKFAHAPMFEFTSITFILGSIYAFIKSRRHNGFKKNILLFFSLICFSLGCLSKISTGIALIPLFVLVIFTLSNYKKSKKELVSTILFIIFTITIGIFNAFQWNNFADSVKQENPITSHLVSSTPQIRNWTFGVIGDRFEIDSWATILLHYFGPISSGFFTLLILSLVAYVNSNNRNKSIVIILVINVLFPIVVFFNLYKNHQYYVSAIYPVVILLLSIGITSFSERTKWKFTSVILIFLLLTSSYSSRHGVLYTAEIFNRSKPPILVEEIKLNTPTESFIMYLGCDWSPEIPYYIDSPTLMVPDWGIKPTQSDLNTIDYLVFCDYFPQDRELRLNEFFPSKYRQISENIYRILN